MKDSTQSEWKLLFLDLLVEIADVFANSLDLASFQYRLNAMCGKAFASGPAEARSGFSTKI